MITHDILSNSCTFVMAFWKDMDLRNKILFSFFCVFTIVGNLSMSFFGDDVWHYNNTASLWNFMMTSAVSWGGRPFINGVTYIFVKLPFFIFQIVNCFLMFCFPIMLAHLVSGGKKLQQALFAVLCLTLMYPFVHMSSAGWLSTTSTYFWPLMAALFAGLVLQKIIQGKQVSNLIKYASLVGVFVAPIEPLTIYVLVLLLLVLVYQKGCVPKFFWWCFGLYIFSLAYTLLLPGVNSRLVSETTTWMPDFGKLTVFWKLYAGYSSTVLHLMFTMNYVYYSFIGLILFHLFVCYKNFPYRLLGIIPLSGLLYSSLNLSDSYQFLHYETLGQYVAIFLSIVCLVSIILSVLIITQNPKYAIAVLVVLGVGLCQRMIMGFSPTLYASATRTFIYLYAGIIATTAWLYWKLQDELTTDQRSTVDTFFMCMAILAFANQNIKYLFF